MIILNQDICVYGSVNIGYWSGDVMWEYGYYIGGFGNVGLVWICWYNSVGYLCVVEWGLSVGVGILA